MGNSEAASCVSMLKAQQMLMYRHDTGSQHVQCAMSVLLLAPVVLCRITVGIYRVSQEERTKLREGVLYVKLYRYNPKHLYPKLNGYGDNGKKNLKL